jgi:hypothetical protein
MSICILQSPYLSPALQRIIGNKHSQYLLTADITTFQIVMRVSDVFSSVQEIQVTNATVLPHEVELRNQV